MGRLGRVAETGEVAAQQALRARVLAHLAESQAARAASRIETYFAREQALWAGGVPRSHALIPRNFETLAPNGGRLGGFSTTETLLPGTRISRFGRETGRYVSPEGTPFQARGLPPERAQTLERVYEVVRPLDVDASIAAHAFGGGGGIQYELPNSIKRLVDSGILKRVQQP